MPMSSTHGDILPCLESRMGRRRSISKSNHQAITKQPSIIAMLSFRSTRRSALVTAGMLSRPFRSNLPRIRKRPPTGDSAVFSRGFLFYALIYIYIYFFRAVDGYYSSHAVLRAAVLLSTSSFSLSVHTSLSLCRVWIHSLTRPNAGWHQDWPPRLLPVLLRRGP